MRGTVGDMDFGEIGLTNIQKDSNETIDFSESCLCGEQWNPEEETE